MTLGFVPQESIGGHEVIHCLSGKSPAGAVYPRICYCGRGVACDDTRVGKQFAWNVKSADRGIFIQIPQNIRQLQSVAQALGKFSAAIVLHTEDTDGETTDGTGD